MVGSPRGRSMRRILRLVGTTAALGAAVQTPAQDDVARRYPNRAVKIIVSAPPGGGLDIAARVIADRLTKMWGQAFGVENPARARRRRQPRRRDGRPGRARRLHLARGAAGAADHQHRDVQEAQLRPVRLRAARNHDLDPQSAHGAARPHAGLYRGTEQAVNDLVAGNVDMLFFQLDSVREQYRANKVKMLAVTTAVRIASVPEVPTMEEAGGKDFRSDSWNALAAPPKTPAAIIAKLNDAINAVLKEPEAAEHLRSMNMTPVGGAPDAAKILIRRES